MRKKKGCVRRFMSMLFALLLTVSELGMTGVSVYAAPQAGTEGEVILCEADPLDKEADADVSKNGNEGYSDEADGQMTETEARTDAGVSENEASIEADASDEDGATEPEDASVSGDEVGPSEVTPSEAEALYADNMEGLTDDAGSEDVMPNGDIVNEEIMADMDVGFVKNKETTLYGTSGMSNPRVPTSAGDPWQGSYVYYGHGPTVPHGEGYSWNPMYYEYPIKYRVLDRYTTAFSPYYNSILLDSDKPLISARYYKGSERRWSESFFKKVLNGVGFLDNALTDIEKSSIINSYKNKPDENYEVIDPTEWSYTFEKLTGEKIFFLDMREAIRPTYGYYFDPILSFENVVVASRIKGFNNKSWYTRTTTNGGFEVYFFNAEGKIDAVIEPLAVPENSGYSAPAFNVNLSSILFSTAIKGTKGELNTEYKLTLIDNDMKIDRPYRKSAIKSGNTISVPYEIIGTDASEANAVSVLILDSPYFAAHTDNPTVLYYDRLETSTFSQNGIGTFTLPGSLSFDKWGTDYYVYLIAEDINGTYETDYASEPTLIHKSSVVEDTSVTVTFDLQGHGNANSRYYQPRKVDMGSTIAEPVEPSESGYAFKGWYTSATDHSSSNEYDFSTPVNGNITLYAYWVKTYAVSFDLTEHPARSGIEPQYVEEGQKAARPETFKVSGYEVVDWYTAKTRWNYQLYDFNTPVTADITLYASWKDVSNCKVTFDINASSGIGPGTVYVATGSKVAKPDNPSNSEGWVFGGWYTDKACSAGKEYDFNAAVNEDMTLYAKWTDKLNLWVNGVQLGKDNLSTGDWTYTPKTNVLNLKNVTFEKTHIEDNNTIMMGSYAYVAYVYSKGVCLNVTGKATTSSSAKKSCNIAGILVADAPVTIDADLDLSGTGAGIYAKYVTIKGGRINISSSVSVEKADQGRGRIYTKTPYGIYADNSVNINGGDVNINMSGSETIGICTRIEDINISGGSLKVSVDGSKKSSAVYANGIDNSLYYVTPAGGKVDASGHFFTDAYGDEAYEIELTAEDSLNRTVTFDLNGKPGTTPAPQVLMKGHKATAPAAPETPGYTFKGWYTKADCKDEDRYFFDTGVTENITLYAGWEENSSSINEFSIEFADITTDPYSGICKTAEGRYETVYTGAAIKPAVTVTGAYGIKLREGVDYTLAYSNNKKYNKNGKPATITVKGKGNYSGSKQLKFYVLQAALDKLASEGMLTIPMQYVKKGSAPSPVIYYGSYQLKAGDMTFDKTKVNADKAVNITGNGNFTGTLTGVEFKVLDAAGIKNGTIKIKLKAGKHIYDGLEHKLGLSTEAEAGELTVTDGNGYKILTGDTDYEVVYRNNTDAGTARLIVRGKGAYRGSATATFKILPDTVNPVEAGLASSETIYHTPAGATPAIAINVTRGGVKHLLNEGSDYMVAYKNNKAAGKGSYTVSFVGNYKGRKAVTGSFTIEKASFSASVTAPDMTYTKKGKYYTKVLVSAGNTLLKEKKDYTVGYFTDAACTAPLPAKYELTGDSATLYAKVTGKGDYATQDKIVSYKLYKLTAVRKIDLGKARIIDGSTGKAFKPQDYTGKPVTPAIRVQVKEGKEWKDVSPSSYQVNYLNNVNKGKAVILVNASGSETSGSKTAAFKIGTRSFGLFSWL